MDKREKVIKGLRCHVYGHPHTRCHDCPYWGTGTHGCSECDLLARDALELLKAQEPVEPKIIETDLSRSYHNDIYNNFYCGKCGGFLNKVSRKDLFCSQCGQAVKWDG